MRRYFIVLTGLVLVGAGAYAVLTCVHGGTPAHTPRGAIAGNFDPAMSGVCRYACATKLKVGDQEVLSQPGAQAGRLTQCPVSGVVFIVDSSRPHVPIAGKDFVACCGNCATKLQGDPHHYLKG